MIRDTFLYKEKKLKLRKIETYKNFFKNIEVKYYFPVYFLMSRNGGQRMVNGNNETYVAYVFKEGSSKSLIGSPDTILYVLPQLAHSSSSPSTFDSLKNA